MALQTVLETLDDVEDVLKAHYTEKDGKFVLGVDGIDAHPEVSNLKSAYERVKADKAKAIQERDEARELAKAMPPDFSLEKWEQAKKGKSDTDELVSVRKTLEAERDEWKGKYESAVGDLRKVTVEGTLSQALADAGVTNPAFQKAARALLLPGISVDDKGNPFVESDMGPLGLAEHVKRWASSDGKDFVAPPSGGGAKVGSGGQVAKKWSEMSGAEKVSLHRKNPEEYERIKAAG